MHIQRETTHTHNKESTSAANHVPVAGFQLLPSVRISSQLVTTTIESFKGTKLPLQSKAFVYKAKRGRKPRAMTITEQALRENPMPLIPLIVNEDSREFIPGNILSLPSISQPMPVVRVTRAYTRKVTTVDVPEVPIVSNLENC